MKTYVRQKQTFEIKRQHRFVMNLKTNHHAKNHFITSSYYF